MAFVFIIKKLHSQKCQDLWNEIKKCKQTFSLYLPRIIFVHEFLQIFFYAARSRESDSLKGLEAF